MYERQIMNVIEKSIIGKKCQEAWEDGLDVMPWCSSLNISYKNWKRMPWRMISAKASCIIYAIKCISLWAWLSDCCSIPRNALRLLPLFTAGQGKRCGWWAMVVHGPKPKDPISTMQPCWSSFFVCPLKQDIKIFLNNKNYYSRCSEHVNYK